MDRRLIKNAIEDYAAACGFNKVIYNKNTFNTVPKKFIEYVETHGVPPTTFEVSLADATTPEYLEAFKWSFSVENAPQFLRTFVNSLFPQIDFVYPKGRISGYAFDIRPLEQRAVVALQEEDESFVTAEAEKVDFTKIHIEGAVPVVWNHIKRGIMNAEQVFSESIQSDEDELREVFEDPRSITLVAMYEDRVIGYAAGGPLENYVLIEGVEKDENFGEQNTIYLFSIVVLPEFQGHAFGHELRKGLLQIAKERGYYFVTAHHQKGIGSSRGDQILNEFKNWYGTGKTYEYVRTDLGESESRPASSPLAIRAGPEVNLSGTIPANILHLNATSQRFFSGFIIVLRFSHISSQPRS